MKNGKYYNQATRSSPSPEQAAPRPRRSDAGQIRFTDRDVRGLALVAQQYAAPYDLLAPYLGVTGSRLRSIIARWKRHGLADSAPLTMNRGWTWVTQHGLDVIGYPWKATPRPSLARLNHHRAVLACRLRLEASPACRKHGAIWRPEREIRASTRTVPSPEHVTDAEVIWPATDRYPEAVWAVEVEMTPKELDRTTRIISGLLNQPYDQVVYFCARPALSIVGRAAARLQQTRPDDAARLVIREVPDAALL